MQHPLLGFTLTPYATMFLAMPLQSVVPHHRGPAAGHLSLVSDHNDQVRELRARLVRQRAAGGFMIV